LDRSKPDGTSAGNPIGFNYSSSCRDSAYGTIEFLDRQSPDDYTVAKVRQNASDILNADHEPDEDLFIAKRENRKGCTLGTVVFCRQELSRMSTALGSIRGKAECEDSFGLVVSLVDDAFSATEACMSRFADYDIFGAYDAFEAAMVALDKIHAIQPRLPLVGAVSRIRKSSTLALELLRFACGK
jgi:hypothetical protein